LHDRVAWSAKHSSMKIATSCTSRALHPVAAFDGSVIVERATGEVSARSHGEQANFLA
jgi:hypothetical protein